MTEPGVEAKTEMHVEISAVVTRNDGTTEDLGVISVTADPEAPEDG